MTKVLIVDDAAFMRITLKKMLEQNGFEVVAEAENGKVAVKKYKEFQPDIVTMDITMPEVDGITALKEINEINKNAKIIMVSAMGQEVLVREAVLNGAKAFIVKPFNEDKFIQVINKISMI